MRRRSRTARRRRTRLRGGLLRLAAPGARRLGRGPQPRLLLRQHRCLRGHLGIVRRPAGDPRRGDGGSRQPRRHPGTAAPAQQKDAVPGPADRRRPGRPGIRRADRASPRRCPQCASISPSTRPSPRDGRCGCRSGPSSNGSTRVIPCSSARSCSAARCVAWSPPCSRPSRPLRPRVPRPLRRTAFPHRNPQVTGRPPASAVRGTCPWAPAQAGTGAALGYGLSMVSK